jgi:Sulfotransferase family
VAETNEAMTGHLIHIGFAKAGSTFLRSWFAQHPQLAYAPGGVAGFRDVYSMVQASASPGPQPLYRVTSAEAFATPHAGFGQDSLDYETIRRTSMPDAQTRACDLLAHLFPTAHILIVTRGFRSMMLSSYSQYLRTGGLDSLATLCALAGAAGAVNQAPWNYDFVIRLYRRSFGEAKVMVLPYELLRDDARAFLGEIARWLGLADIGVPPGRLNPSLAPSELAWYPRIGRRIRALPLGERGRRKAWRLYVRAVLRNRLKAPIALLQRVRPVPPVNDAVLTPELIDGFRGLAAGLRDEPIYRAYARDYLFE